jgi:hypothetical protein
MATGIVYTDPSEHPSFVREGRHIKNLLARMLTRHGRTEQEAVREAEVLLTAPRTEQKAEGRKNRAFRAAC